MASPALQSERELSEAQDIVSNGNGSYTLTEEAIKEAADSDRDVVIELTAKEIGEEIIVNNGEGLRKVLESEGDVKVVLDDAIENKTIEVTEAITVKGNKVLELNGITLDVKLSGESENFLTVSQGARLEITDEASKNIVPEGIAHKATTSNDNNAREIEQLAKLGSYDADSKMLTYSVSKSKTNSSTGTTKEYRDTYEVKLSAAGAITSTEINALVKVEAGGNFVMEGGRLTNTGGKHGVEAQGEGAKVTLSGGFIVGNGAAAHGAGVYVSGNESGKASLLVNGNAVIGGNIVDASVKIQNGYSGPDNKNAVPYNGGGIYLDCCEATIAGHAIVAGNKASAGPAVETKNDDAYAKSARNLVQKSNGGGIYLSSQVTLKLSGEAVIAGNRAARDGGGIYVYASKDNALHVPTNSLVIDGNDEGVNLSNNEASHDMTDLNPGKDENGNGQTRNWQMTPMGGGAIFSMGNVTINGGAQFVNNKAGDAGGAIMLPQIGGYEAAQLKIDDVVVAGNYAGSSEGGGIWCQPKASTKYGDNAGSDAAKKTDFSYIKGGYITNNASGTVFDYGGGGLYVNKDGYLCLYNPLVTGNTAYGWGGGVAGCHNGFVLSNKIAMFDNTAKQAGYTSNANEYADRWAFDEEYLGKLESNASADFFTGRESTVQDEMLGGGSHNWTGYTSGSAVNATFTRIDWNNAKLDIQPTTGPSRTIKLFSTNFEPGNNTSAFAYLPESVDFDEMKTILTGAVADFVGTTNDKGLGIIKSVERKIDKDAPGYYKISMALDRAVSKPAGDGGAIYDKDDHVVTDALSYHKSFQSDLSQGSINSGQKVLRYNVYKIATEEGSNPDVPVVSKFPKGGKVHTNRFLALKANPTKEAKEKAFRNACVFVSGNYSQTNGGGIANNGYIDLGSPKGEEGNKPKPTEFNLTLVKVWDKFDKGTAEANGTFTAVFRIRAYESKAAFDIDKKNNSNDSCTFETVRALTFAKGEAVKQTIKVEKIPKGSYVVVEEMSAVGDNFTSAVVANGVLDGNSGLTMTKDETATFENTYTDDKTYGTGVVNSYTQGAGGDSDDGGIQVTQDNLYKKNHPAPAEQQGLANQTDPVVAQASGE